MGAFIIYMVKVLTSLKWKIVFTLLHFDANYFVIGFKKVKLFGNNELYGFFGGRIKEIYVVGKLDWLSIDCVFLTGIEVLYVNVW